MLAEYFKGFGLAGFPKYILRREREKASAQPHGNKEQFAYFRPYSTCVTIAETRKSNSQAMHDFAQRWSRLKGIPGYSTKRRER
jgi:hypothetical protein